MADARGVAVRRARLILHTGLRLANVASVRMAQPRRPWQVPVQADLLVCSALAHGRPIALVADTRVGGLPDDDVARRYRTLRAALLERADAETTAALATLETMPPDFGYTRWQSAVWATQGAEEPEVIDLAWDVWEALGQFAYEAALRQRPRTWRGSLVARLWGLVASGGAVLLGAGAAMEVDSGHTWGWWLLPAGAAWAAAVLWLMARRRRVLARDPMRELPHL